MWQAIFVLRKINIIASMDPDVELTSEKLCSFGDLQKSAGLVMFSFLEGSAGRIMEAFHGASEANCFMETNLEAAKRRLGEEETGVSWSQWEC